MLFRSWINTLLSLGYSKPLVLEDMPSLVLADEADLAYQKFAHAWDSLVREKKRSLQSPSVPYKECGGLVHLLNLFLCTYFSGVLSTWGTSMHNYMLVVHMMVFCFC